MKSEELIKIAVKALDSKKARDIEVINVEGLTMLGDYLVIASGTSNTQVRSLAEEVEYKLSQEGIEPHHIEGRTTQWYLLDYGDVMVHVFHSDARNFYALERRWADGEKVDISHLLTED